MSRTSLVLPFVCLVLLACGDPAHDEEPEVQQLPATLQSAQPIDHGALVFGRASALSLARETPQYLFAFTLTAPARVELRTFADDTGRVVDTVLSLGREGSSRYFALADDDGSSRFSRLVRELPAGAYRVLIAGFKRSSTGSFLFSATCAGAGCPAAASSCLFGDTFYALRSERPLQVLDEHWLRSIDAIASALEGQQLLIAVQQSSHSDVTTPAEALAAVDQNEVRRMRLRDGPSGREYDVFEYGVGDNSYGAIFRADTLFKAASIHDGDLLECTER
jgi:hypothetical protein